MVVLTSAGDNQVVQVDPGFPNQIRPLIVVEHGDFQFEVIGGLVHRESKFVVPGMKQVSYLAGNSFSQ